MSNFEIAKAMCVEAEKAVLAAKESYLVTTEALYVELLALKGLKVEQTCSVTDSNGKKIKGVFRIVRHNEASALRFFPYKKDGALSNSPRAFDFGALPNVGWDASCLTSVIPCAPPEPIVAQDGV